MKNILITTLILSIVTASSAFASDITSPNYKIADAGYNQSSNDPKQSIAGQAQLLQQWLDANPDQAQQIQQAIQNGSDPALALKQWLQAHPDQAQEIKQLLINQ